METLERQDDLFEQDWITTFVAARDLLRRDATPVAQTLASTAAGTAMTVPYGNWDRHD